MPFSASRLLGRRMSLTEWLWRPDGRRGGMRAALRPAVFVPFGLPSVQRGCYGFAADTVSKKTNLKVGQVQSNSG